MTGSPDVSRQNDDPPQHTADDVAQMRHVVHVRQSAGDEDVTLARLGQRELVCRSRELHPVQYRHEQRG